MTKNLLSYHFDHFERLLGADGVYKHVAMNSNEMLRGQDAIFILSKRIGVSVSLGSAIGDLPHLPGSINYLRLKVLSFISDSFGEGVFYGRVVAFDEVSVHELNREGGFPFSKLATLSKQAKGICIIPTDRLPTNAILRCFG